MFPLDRRYYRTHVYHVLPLTLGVREATLAVIQPIFLEKFVRKSETDTDYELYLESRQPPELAAEHIDLQKRIASVCLNAGASAGGAGTATLSESVPKSQVDAGSTGTDIQSDTQSDTDTPPATAAVTVTGTDTVADTTTAEAAGSSEKGMNS